MYANDVYMCSVYLCVCVYIFVLWYVYVCMQMLYVCALCVLCMYVHVPCVYALVYIHIHVCVFMCCVFVHMCFAVCQLVLCYYTKSYKRQTHLHKKKELYLALCQVRRLSACTL